MSHKADETPTQYVSPVGTPRREHSAIRRAERRRLALDVLSERTTSIETGALATAVATQEDGTDVDSEATFAEVLIDLHHVHLPKLDEAGALDYDPERRVVEPVDQSTGADERDGSGRSRDETDAAGRIGLRDHVTAYFDASTSETASVYDLARYAATEMADIDDGSAERILLRLHHTVLPRLAESDGLDYDSQTKMVRYRRSSA